MNQENLGYSGPKVGILSLIYNHLNSPSYISYIIRAARTIIYLNQLVNASFMKEQNI